MVDSSVILAHTDIIPAERSDHSELETLISQMSSADLRSRWGFLSKQYTEEYEQCIESILVSDKGNYSIICLHLSFDFFEVYYELNYVKGDVY